MESIIIAIVIGIIASVTNRMKENNEKPVPRRTRPAPSEVPKKTVVEQKVQTVKATVKEKAEQAKPGSRQPVREAGGRMERTAAHPYNREAKRQNKASDQALNMDEADLVNGIILSEILAPPKARRKK
ncbi:hypothetical protein JOC78_002978 [Bacillus ectoiniformans]|uniref:hypothetical protein n=1 Tax=Bacillus ectoiniformans TaxID=1494429 RepID=UPI0019576B05|nr:hypothetical protein [Bacillus ectoiniformans]MBM7649994.1 hypothetical protein [Bacillus ectoiniformans]